MAPPYSEYLLDFHNRPQEILFNFVLFMMNVFDLTLFLSWYEGFYSAALGVAVLVGEYYLITYGYRFVKSKIEKEATARGITCKVVLSRIQTIWYAQPEKVSQTDKAALEFNLALYLIGLIAIGILWLGLLVGLGMLLQLVA
ncbi:hypothetical protein [Flagellimonas flava]|uniref:Uncharacterized protein n=1 Tax=Flagellimonas flava TaxID=570519 RepID=A0A1M5MDZ1_9FLAO|nr:hypothetical protein [Allomuricauda flava]SHG75560.1 hypothetical protein SAMN04488116_2405 [Allomuricauda flava]